eukprot:6805968-Pyramimonas_sp.AAC.1
MANLSTTFRTPTPSSSDCPLCEAQVSDPSEFSQHMRSHFSQLPLLFDGRDHRKHLSLAAQREAHDQSGRRRRRSTTAAGTTGGRPG